MKTNITREDLSELTIVGEKVMKAKILNKLSLCKNNFIKTRDYDIDVFDKAILRTIDKLKQEISKVKCG